MGPLVAHEGDALIQADVNRAVRGVLGIGSRPGDGWRDPEALAKLPSDAARKVALQVADALDVFHAARQS